MAYFIFTQGLTIKAQTDILTKKFEQENRPYLSAEILPEPVHVGKGRGRVDDYVTIPITINNDGKTAAYNIELDVIILDDSNKAEGVSINASQQGVNARITKRATLAAGANWERLRYGPSVLGDAREIYKSGENGCKIKILLRWEDLEGKEYKWITLAKLQYEQRVENFKEEFWWDDRNAITSWKDPEKVKTHWGTKFNF